MEYWYNLMPMDRTASACIPITSIVPQKSLILLFLICFTFGGDLTLQQSPWALSVMCLIALERTAISKKVGTPTMSATRYWRQNWCAVAIAIPVLLYCHSGLVRKKKKNLSQLLQQQEVVSLLRGLHVRKGNISLHFTFTWNFFPPLLLIRFCSFSWYLPTTLELQGSQWPSAPASLWHTIQLDNFSHAAEPLQILQLDELSFFPWANYITSMKYAEDYSWDTFAS